MRKSKMLAVVLSISIFSIIIYSLFASATVMENAGCLKVSKSWDGDDLLAPELVIVDIYNSSDNKVVGILYLNEQNNWADTFCNLAPGEYYVKERPVSGFDTFYPAGNRVQITDLNDSENPVELEIVNEYAYPPRTFKLSIYEVTIVDDIYRVTVTVCADQDGSIERDIYFNDQKSEVDYIDSKPITLLNKGECQQITFEINVGDLDLSQPYYVGYTQPNQWIEIGEPRQFIPVSIAKLEDLYFGSFTVADGTITVDPAGVLTTGNGYSGYHDGNQQSAVIEVIWLPYTQYNINFTDQTIISHDANNKMTVSTFVTDNDSKTLDGNGYGIFNIGATLDVNANLDPGLYSGQFFVTVTFE
jgi:hypothetical protein